MSETIKPHVGQEFKKFINNRQSFDDYNNKGTSSVFTYSKSKLEDKTLQSDMVEFGKDYAKTYDKDGDGISLDEFRSSENADYKEMFPNEPMTKAAQKLTDEMQARTFNEFDTDGDKKIDAKEMSAYIATLDGADGNMDGNIQYSTFAGISSIVGQANQGFISNLKAMKEALFLNKK